MNKKQRDILILSVVGLVLVTVVLYQFRSSSSSSTPTTSAKTAQTSKKDPAAKKDPKAPKDSPTSAKSTAPAKPKKGGPTTVEVDTTDDAETIKRTTVNIDELISSIKEVDFEYNRDEIPRDPLRPLIGTLAVINSDTPDGAVPVASEARVRNKAVTGIVWNPLAPFAIVDNEVVVPGFVYPDGTEVESIAPSHVVFKVADSLIQVQLKEQ